MKIDKTIEMLLDSMVSDRHFAITYDINVIFLEEGMNSLGLRYISFPPIPYNQPSSGLLKELKLYARRNESMARSLSAVGG